MTRTEMVNNTIEQLKNIEEYYYNAFEGNIFEIATYLYLRYGELPVELENDSSLENISRLLSKQETLFSSSLNEEIEDLIN